MLLVPRLSSLVSRYTWICAPSSITRLGGSPKNAAALWALRDITSVELYPGVEVLFRRDDPPAMLFVSVKGRVALVA